MNKAIYFSVIISLIIWSSCKQDPGVTNVKMGLESKLDTLNREEVGSIMAPAEQVPTRPGEPIYSVSVKSSPAEKAADEELVGDAIEAIKNSKYSTCNDVLTDYELCIEELKKGNTTPMMNFPLDTDPFCKVCYEGEDFKVKLDSLKRIAKRVHKQMLK
ncbi:MAG: hypothetical protein IPN29_17120 [Saprospiraceae bacterium]|nr:hypothetical protein [Saprospiraceae bacterium]